MLHAGTGIALLSPLHIEKRSEGLVLPGCSSLRLNLPSASSGMIEVETYYSITFSLSRENSTAQWSFGQASRCTGQPELFIKRVSHAEIRKIPARRIL